jgi:hypothetical protein
MLGMTGFVIGFFGPMQLQPGSNQGPMLGIFVTGPAGVLLGGVAGGWLRMARPDWPMRWRLWGLNIANVAYGLFVLDVVADLGGVDDGTHVRTKHAAPHAAGRGRSACGGC